MRATNRTVMLGRFMGAASLLVMASATQAQDAPADANAASEQAADAAQDVQQGEDIIVTGFRASLDAALNVKRESRRRGGCDRRGRHRQVP